MGGNRWIHFSQYLFQKQGKGKERQKSPGLKELKQLLAEGCHFSAVTVRVTCWKWWSNWGISLLKTLLIFLTFFIFLLCFFPYHSESNLYQYQRWQWNNKLLEQCFLKLGSLATCGIICLKGRSQTPFRPMWWNRWQLLSGILPFNKFPRWF